MPLTSDYRELGDVFIVDLKGRITLGEGSVQMRDAIRGLVGNGMSSILLNLGEADYIDSSGLGELVGACNAAKMQGAKVKLMKLTPRVHNLFQIARLYPVFDIYDDETSALASFK